MSFRATSIVSLFVLGMGCTLSTNHPATSEPKIDHGLVLDGKGGDSIQAIFSTVSWPLSEGGGLACTGTAVSTTTAITASHCIHKRNRGITVDADGLVHGLKNYCIVSGVHAKLCSNIVYTNPLYMEKLSDPNAKLDESGADVTIVIFPEGTFKNFVPLASNAAKVGDKVELVGYSGGPKRWGSNIISALITDQRDVMQSMEAHDDKSLNAAMDSGDSGGPLLEKCRIAGIASSISMDIDANDQEIPNTKVNQHTNIFQKDNLAFLVGMKAKGALICGLHIIGDDPHCPADRRLEPIEADAKTFPCASKIDALKEK